MALRNLTFVSISSCVVFINWEHAVEKVEPVASSRYGEEQADFSYVTCNVGNFINEDMAKEIFLTYTALLVNDADGRMADVLTLSCHHVRGMATISPYGHVLAITIVRYLAGISLCAIAVNVVITDDALSNVSRIFYANNGFAIWLSDSLASRHFSIITAITQAGLAIWPQIL